MKIIASLSIAAALLVAALAHTEVRPLPDGETTNAARDAREPLKLPLVSPRIRISKSGRRLDLYSDGRVVREYRVALGKNASDDKERQGDYRTPEGEFYVCVKNAASKFYLSLGLSYPNREDAERGLRDHLITRAERDRIVRAIERGLRPPWDTALGGEIFIHGGGSASDWTWGCVALDDADVRELFDAVPKGAKVVIEH
ncbi:MAG TPA: L,D-transpeptidase [Pyrinomonadaceae bacterium]|jgi:murein L,D-transpeptidase YafK|nr:L,D-transpeptidase [Pyrinomonadaceae bacterium]